MDAKLSKNIQSYIELVYSEKSELNIIADLEERKRTACQKAKLDPAAEDVKLILQMRDKTVNEQIFEYLRQQNSNEFILLISDQHLFWELMQRNAKPMAEGIDAELKDLDLKTKISEKAEQLLERIVLRRNKIFKGDAEDKMAEDKIRILSPEQRLKQRKST